MCSILTRRYTFLTGEMIDKPPHFVCVRALCGDGFSGFKCEGPRRSKDDRPLRHARRFSIFLFETRFTILMMIHTRLSGQFLEFRSLLYIFLSLGEMEESRSARPVTQTFYDHTDVPKFPTELT